MLAVLLTVTIQCLNIGAEKWVSVDGEYILFITLRTSQSTPGNMVHVMSNMTWSVVVVIRQLLAALRKPKPVCGRPETVARFHHVNRCSSAFQSKW